MDKTKTFAELGIPFRLYEAPIACCSNFLGRGACSLCQRPEQWIFRAGVGDYLVVACAHCDQINALGCSDKKDVTCSKCAELMIWPLSRVDDVRVCYNCMRAGRVWFTQDTALGMVRWEDAQRGWTHGVPLEMNVSLSSRPSADDPEWYEYALPPDDAEELGRTPGYISWQSESWPFHCGRVMVYIGEPKARPRSENTPEVVAAVEALIEREGWDLKGVDPWKSFLCVYVFRCDVCGAFDGHVDCD